MVECFPSHSPPESAPLSPTVELTDNSKETLEKVHEIQGSPPPNGVKTRSNASLHSILLNNVVTTRVNLPAAFIRSNSTGNIRTSVSPLPENFQSAADDLGTKPDRKHIKTFDQQFDNEELKPSNESDTFLNASMQLMNLNGEARQRVRQLWTSVQELGRDNQISETGMDVLYVELGNILKNMSAEKLEATKYLKTGRLVLLASTPAVEPGTLGSGAAVKALFGARSTAQLLQCALSEDQSKLEMVPVRSENAVRSVGANTSSSVAVANSSRFGLPTKASLIGMISDAFQEEPLTRVIKLQGCQVRKLVPKSLSNDTTSLEENSSTGRSTSFHRFQVLVPYKTQMNDRPRADGLFPTKAPTPYESFIFEIPTSSSVNELGTEAEAEVDDWVFCLDRVCQYQLHRLEHSLREAPTIDHYRQILQRHFPVCVSVSWLRNRVDQQTPQRRASVNLSMIQIVKDLGRDKVLVDGHLFSAADPYESNSVDSVSEVVKFMVRKILEFERQVERNLKTPGSSAIPSHQLSSPAHRFAKNSEARALAFVERVLHGSSRTQSGGDIYDAISFFCQQEHVSICPVSQDARPVQMKHFTDVSKSVFLVEVQVCMQFKVIELTPRSPTPRSFSEEGASSNRSPRHESLREWAVLEGTLSRQFTLGQLAAPGTITINYIS